MGKDTHYAIDEYRIVDGLNVEIKAHVRARFDEILRSVDFTGTVPLEHLIEYALKQAKLTLATRIRQQALRGALRHRRGPGLRALRWGRSFWAPLV